MTTHIDRHKLFKGYPILRWTSLLILIYWLYKIIWFLFLRKNYDGMSLNLIVELFFHLCFIGTNFWIMDIKDFHYITKSTIAKIGILFFCILFLLLLFVKELRNMSFYLIPLYYSFCLAYLLLLIYKQGNRKKK